MVSVFSLKVKLSTRKEKSSCFKLISQDKSVISRSIRWKNINFPHEWVIKGAVEPKLPAPPRIFKTK